MPLTQFICLDGQKTCIKECTSGKCRMRNRCAPLPYLREAANQREWSGLPSTTQLLNGTREEYLKITSDYAVKPYSRAFAVLGTGAHGFLNTDDDWSYNEERLFDDIASGQFDRVEKQENAELWNIEYKTYGSYKVMKALGLVPRKRPAFYPNGDPILYQKSGAWGKAGTQKTETFFVREGVPDMEDLMLQINRNRMLFEKEMGEKISRNKCFIIVRDGNTRNAKDNGIYDECVYLDVPMLDDAVVDEYFTRKSKALISALVNKELPRMCSEKETWNGIKCESYCNVREACRAAGGAI